MPFFPAETKKQPTEREIATSLLPQVEAIFSQLEDKTKGHKKTFKEKIAPVVIFSILVAKAIEPYPELDQEKVLSELIAMQEETPSTMNRP